MAPAGAIYPHCASWRVGDCGGVAVVNCIRCEYRHGLECHHPDNSRPVRIVKSRLTTDEPCRRDMECYVVWDIYRSWTPEEIEIVRSNLDMPMFELQTKLKRTASAIYNMRSKIRRESKRSA